ncbi:hypothetical protein PUN28_002476 [Cardiocondyla obscurior]|uniref:Uncharacterized protein n=1 Tax=Cardiocondyla obscurior TaxID=286306 RepID=A0AAW2GUF4_9HYME
MHARRPRAYGCAREERTNARSCHRWRTRFLSSLSLHFACRVRARRPAGVGSELSRARARARSYDTTKLTNDYDDEDDGDDDDDDDDVGDDGDEGTVSKPPRRQKPTLRSGFNL